MFSIPPGGVCAASFSDGHVPCLSVFGHSSPLRPCPPPPPRSATSAWGPPRTSRSGCSGPRRRRRRSCATARCALPGCCLPQATARLLLCAAACCSPLDRCAAGALSGGLSSRSLALSRACVCCCPPILSRVTATARSCCVEQHFCYVPEVRGPCGPNAPRPSRTSLRRLCRQERLSS